MLTVVWLFPYSSLLHMNVLITGGTGLIGTRLTTHLQAAGHSVAVLSRSSSAEGASRVFQWHPAQGTIDPAAIPWANALVNLAGANVGEGRWTDKRKQAIRASRLDSLAVLHRELAKPGHHVQTVLSASAVGIYGHHPTPEPPATEDARPASHDFLAELSQQWEQATAPIAALGIRLVLPRIGIVLSTAGGALPALAGSVRLGVGAPLGSGQQYLSWIHIDDLCQLFIIMLTEEAWQGPYNAMAPYPVNNEAFTEILADVLHRPLWLPKIPASVLRLAMGEMSEMVLTGRHLSAAKVLDQGFQFTYPTLGPALQNLFASAD